MNEKLKKVKNKVKFIVVFYLLIILAFILFYYKASLGFGNAIIETTKTVIELKSESITISNNGINRIDLRKCITIDSLKTAFPNYKVTPKIGQQDGPDYQYFEVKKDNSTINFIMSEQEGCLVDEINATTNLLDIYGVKVGMTYEEVKKLRPEITYKTNYHFHTILSAPNSNLKYEISGTFDGPDKQDFIYDEVKKWKVTQFLIRSY